MGIQRGTIQIVLSHRVVRSRRLKDMMAKFFIRRAAKLTSSKIIKEKRDEYPTIPDHD